DGGKRRAARRGRRRQPEHVGARAAPGQVGGRGGGWVAEGGGGVAVGLALGVPGVEPDLGQFADGQVEAAALVVSRGSVSRSAAAAELACCWLPGHFLPQGLDVVPEPPPHRHPLAPYW